MTRKLLLAALLLAWMGCAARATVDGAMCSASDAGSTCSGAEVVTSTNEELAELHKLGPRLLASVAGTNTITASATPAVTAYADGQLFLLQPAADNTGAVTLSINGVTAAALTDANGGALPSGAILSTRTYLVRYRASSSAFRLVTPGLRTSLQVFTSSGTYTEPADLVGALVTSTGGGGGGGGADASSATDSYAAGGGGGAGATCVEYLAASEIASTETVTIGAPGTAGSATSGTNGSAGGNTTFGALHTAAGGSGGTGANPGATTTTAGAGGAGGACTGGDINLTGGPGRTGRPLSGPNSFIQVGGGDGGTGSWGSSTSGGIASSSGATAGSAGASYGSGGGGAGLHTTTTGAAGGAGAGGIVTVLEFRE